MGQIFLRSQDPISDQSQIHHIFVDFSEYDRRSKWVKQKHEILPRQSLN